MEAVISEADPQRKRHTFELTADDVVLEPGTLAKDFEASIKAPRIIGRRTEGT